VNFVSDCRHQVRGGVHRGRRQLRHEEGGTEVGRAKEKPE